MGQTSAVLVIDDDAGIRETLAEYLRAVGYHVDVAGDGVEGLERLSETRPDVILVDLRMPGMDGRRFLELVRADPARRTLPVVLMSGTSSAGEAATSADAVLRKPFELDELLDLLRRFRPPGQA